MANNQLFGYNEGLKKAFEDIWAGLSAFQVWYSLGKIELIQKYRRCV